MRSRLRRGSRLRAAGRVAARALLPLAAPILVGCASVDRERLPLSLETARGYRKAGLTTIRETPHIVYRHAPDRGVSPRDMHLAEEHVVRVADALGIRPPHRLLYLLVTREWMKLATGRTFAHESIPRPGLATIEGFGTHPGDRTSLGRGAFSDEDLPFEGIVLSFDAAHLHELTHCVSALLLSPADYLRRSPLVFEGLAVAWDGRGRGSVDRRLRELWGGEGPLYPSELVTAFPFEASDGRIELAYHVAGSFCAFLLRARGKEAFHELFTRGTKDRFAEVFERTMGAPLESLERAWIREVVLADPGAGPDQPLPR